MWNSVPKGLVIFFVDFVEWMKLVAFFFEGVGVRGKELLLNLWGLKVDSCFRGGPILLCLDVKKLKWVLMRTSVALFVSLAYIVVDVDFVCVDNFWLFWVGVPSVGNYLLLSSRRNEWFAFIIYYVVSVTCSDLLKLLKCKVSSLNDSISPPFPLCSKKPFVNLICLICEIEMRNSSVLSLRDVCISTGPYQWIWEPHSGIGIPLKFSHVWKIMTLLLESYK